VATRIKEKALKRKENRDQRPKATAKYIRMSPRKVKAVIDLIRNKKIDEAQAILVNTPKAATQPVLKVLN
jgi:large subunit ribosomal protein L22